MNWINKIISLFKSLDGSAMQDDRGKTPISKIKRPIEKVIIHCSATPDGIDYTVEDIDEWHKERGWSGVGYHFVITVDGMIQKGRSLSRAGAHTKGQNSKSIGVCLIGTQVFSVKQFNALRHLVDDIQEVYPDTTLHGHREFANKLCPGFDVQEFFKSGKT